MSNTRKFFKQQFITIWYGKKMVRRRIILKVKSSGSSNSQASHTDVETTRWSSGEVEADISGVLTSSSELVLCKSVSGFNSRKLLDLFNSVAVVRLLLALELWLI
jgi:hypothetical protein